uniref:Tankyrase-2 n=1 Tax=Sinocyclocheilus anshuiensis TaxID=1608454 RepID=A0A671RHL9_9TELE
DLSPASPPPSLMSDRSPSLPAYPDLSMLPPPSLPDDEMGDAPPPPPPPSPPPPSSVYGGSLVPPPPPPPGQNTSLTSANPPPPAGNMSCSLFRPSCQAFGIVCVPHFPLSAHSLSMSVRRFSGVMESSWSAEPRELFEACRSEDLERVKKLVCPVNVNSRDTAGRKSTPLHFAAGFGRRDVVDYLLQHGANVHARDDGGLISLHNACSFGHAEVVNLLLQHGADANSRDNWNYTPLHEATIKGKIDVCIVLLQHGAEPTIRNTDGRTALDLAEPSTKAVLTGDYRKDELLESARSGNEEKLMSLLTPLNVNCHASDGRKSTPLHLAAGYNRVKTVQLLLQHGADVHAKDKGDLVPLHNACSYGHYEVAELLVKHGACVNAMDLWQFTPLHEAVSKNRVEVCSLLLSYGADPTFLNCHNKSAIDLAPTALLKEHLAYEFRGHALLQAAREADMAHFKKHLSLETINFKHPLTQETALHCVSTSPYPKRKQICELLLRKGANVNEKNKDFLTPLHLAAEKSHNDIIEVLVKHEAKVSEIFHSCSKTGFNFKMLLNTFYSSPIYF